MNTSDKKKEEKLKDHRANRTIKLASSEDCNPIKVKAT